MGRLIIIAGASGAGKSFLLEKIDLLYNNKIIPIKKLSTRGKRPHEKEDTVLDLVFNVKRKEVHQCDYRYEYGNNLYGIKKIEIERILSTNKSPLLIVRDGETIRIIKKDYPNALVLYIQSGYSGDELRKILEKQGRKDINIDDRMSRLKTDHFNYIEHFILFDHVLINYFDNLLIEHFRKIYRYEVLDTNHKNPNYIFVIMSFKKEMDGFFKHIKEKIEKYNSNLIVERIDLKKGDYRITNEILKSIAKAELLICDLTYERPNVYYELGFSRGIHKKVISCAKEGTKIHFDIKDFHTIYYKDINTLGEEILHEIKFHYNEKKNPKWLKD